MYNAMYFVDQACQVKLKLYLVHGPDKSNDVKINTYFEWEASLSSLYIIYVITDHLSFYSTPLFTSNKICKNTMLGPL